MLKYTILTWGCRWYRIRRFINGDIATFKSDLEIANSLYYDKYIFR